MMYSTHDLAQKLPSHKQTDKDMTNLVTQADAFVVELKLILQADMLENVKTKLDNLYMVLVLCAILQCTRNSTIIRDQILTDQTVPNMEDLITHLLRLPPPKIYSSSNLVEPTTMVTLWWMICGDRRGHDG
ncbi:hypothetical protein AAHE18_08G188900 [Arachis hypogaea]